MRKFGCWLLAMCANVMAADYVPADLLWSLNNDPTVVFTSLTTAIDKNCEQLKANPPTVNNIATTVVNCGQLGSASSVTKRVNVAYTLRLVTNSLQADKQIKSNFTLTHKVSCSTPGFKHLQEEPSAAYRYTCWRCAVSDRKAKPPRFLSDGNVRWFSANQCPFDIPEQPVIAKTKDTPATEFKPAALPPVLGLPYEDSVALHVEKQAPHGQIVALLFSDGQRKYFIGARDDQRLTPAHSQWGFVQHKDHRWQWQNKSGTRFVFEDAADDYLQVATKRLASGESWQFQWIRLPLVADTPNINATFVTRLEWAIDQNDQRYTFFYDDKGELSRVSIDGRERYSNPSVTMWGQLFDRRAYSPHLLAP